MKRKVHVSSAGLALPLEVDGVLMQFFHVAAPGLLIGATTLSIYLLRLTLSHPLPSSNPHLYHVGPQTSLLVTEEGG